MADLLAVALRGLSFVAGLQAAGAPLFLWLFGDALEHSTRRIERLARWAAFLGLLLTVAHELIEPARMAGELGGVFDPSLQLLLLRSDAGTASAVRVLGLALAALGSLKPGRFGSAIAFAGANLIVVSFAFMGHTATHELRWLLASLLIVHLLIVAFWFGALLPLYLVGRHENLTTSGLIIERFSALALRLVPLIFVAGFALAAVLLPSLSSLATPYGTLLLAKVGGFALLMALAAMNKWRLGPSIVAGREHALGAFRASVLTEWALIAAILAVTATMTALFSP